VKHLGRSHCLTDCLWKSEVGIVSVCLGVGGHSLYLLRVTGDRRENSESD
jgi:hypothetical protein